MPAINITYEEDEVRALIAKDICQRFGIKRPCDEAIQPSVARGDGIWEVSVDSGNLNASHARHVDED
ncbi:hypothetical protein [Salipiger sp. PrR003]|uniref:hypothetical protein n=1 Tax=Salipiger sp. PrR003 TaxID=2706776 RepID=UPI0013D9BC17|nr:hypothetical protein [Salipiger sp. PrR003]NDV53404.1 hypothetical protein [Salipiger sp. PrR003]